MINWLESIHTGGFQTGTLDDVAEQVKKRTADNSYKDPTQTLPEAPQDDLNYSTWQHQFEETVDDLLLKSNVHNLKSTPQKAAEKEKTKTVMAAETTNGASARLDFRGRFLMKRWLILIQEPSA
jgi:hypothetical protein